jgi:hypothetical protein
MAVERLPARFDPRELAKAPSPEEIARRRKVMAETLELRDTIGPIDMTTSELLEPEEDD